MKYHETEHGILYHGDCLDILPTLPDKSIDAVVTDPPYGTNDGKGKAIKRSNKVVSFCDNDWDRTLPLDFYVSVNALLKNDTWGVVFTDNMAITSVWDAITKSGLSPRNTYYWIKTNKAPTPRSNFKSCVETAIAFTKGRTNQKWSGGGNTPNYYMSPFCSNGNHPTEKRVDLMQRLVEVISERGDIVLDCFAGSGTTAIACIRLNRKYILIEKEEKYCEIAAKRIEAELAQADFLRDGEL